MSDRRTRKRRRDDDASSGGGDSAEEAEEVDDARPKKKAKKVGSIRKDDPAKKTRLGPPEDEEEEALMDCSYMRLKVDAEARPMWIAKNGRIFLETFNPLYRVAYDFLIAIAEPVCRANLIHEYQLTAYSLYAAVSIGLKTEKIIEVMGRLSKVDVPEECVAYIRNNTTNYGKVKLVLKQNTWFLESAIPEVLRRLLEDSVIKNARMVREGGAGDSDIIVTEAPTKIMIPGASKVTDEVDGLGGNGAADGTAVTTTGAALREGEESEEEEGPVAVHSFEIKPEHIEAVRKRCIELDFPTLDEYDFRNDTYNPSVDIDLKPTTAIRSYQEKSLRKMFGEGRGRSGIIVLPCGAGKTLVGITAACTVRKSCLVLCTSTVACEQWKRQFLMWARVNEENVCRFTSDNKELPPKEGPGILISTYSMVAYSGKRSKEAETVMKYIQSREWGLIILDEVHVAPADMFRRVLELAKSHCKLGLTATLVREDDLINDLNYLIGPKLYEANWIDLQRNGFIAKVQCAEVWCQMTADFYREYLRDGATLAKKKLLYVMNPRKFQACQSLMALHEARGDKILIFSDNIFALKMYADFLNKPYIYGGTSSAERLRILYQFQHNPQLNTILISAVGDTSIDLPEATVLIQIASHFGSRRQEAQRLGRILRPKSNLDDQFNSFFYSLVSQDTQEMYYSTKRQQFLIDQGYAFKVVKDSQLPVVQGAKLALSSAEEQRQLLIKIQTADDKEGETEDIIDEDVQFGRGEKKRPAATRKPGNMKALSGADDLQYIEYERPSGAQGGKRHRLFQERYRRPGDAP